MTFDEKEYSRQWYIKNRDKVLKRQEQRRRERGQKPAKRYLFTDDQKAEIVDRLLNTQATTRSIADEIGCSKSTIDKIFRAATTKEQRLNAKRRKQVAIVRDGKWSNAQKEKSRKRVQHAVRDGLIQKPTMCEMDGCSNTENIEGHHHNGYSDDHALDVMWLCRECHKQVHREKIKRKVKHAQSGAITQTEQDDTPLSEFVRTWKPDDGVA